MSVEARLTELEARLERAEARSAIWDVMARYARAMDEEDNNDLAAVFAADATCETVPWSKGKVFEGRESIVRLFNGYQARFKNRKRFITNERIEVKTGDSASGWSNWLVVHANDGGSYIGWGSYELEFGKRLDAHGDGIWEITHMTVKVDTMTTLDNGWADVETALVRFPKRPTSTQ